MKIVIVGNYGSTNLGDELILLGLLYKVFELFPEASVTIPSALPEETERLCKFYFPEKSVVSVPRLPFGLRSFFRTVQRGGHTQTLEAFRNADAVILGGGGLFADDESWSACPFWYVQASPALHFQKPLVAYGLGVGPIRGRLAKYFTKKLLTHAKFLGVRDTSSMRMLSSFFPSRNIRLTADPIFFLDEAISHQAMSMKKPYVALSLRNFPGWNEELFKTFAKILDFLIEEKNLEVVFIPFQTFRNDDTEIFRRIIVHTQQKDHVFIPPFEEKNILKNIGLSIQYIKNASFTFGMRLHSNLLSALLETPFLPILYGQKTEVFLKDNFPDLLPCAIKFEADSYETIKDKIESFSEKSDDFKMYIKTQKRRLVNLNSALEASFKGEIVVEA